MIDRDALDEIHRRVLNGDVTSSGDLFRLVHPALAAAVRKKVGPMLSWDDAGDRATDAIVEYLNGPTKFDPSRSGLFGYLLLIARGDALNTVRDQGREQKNLARVVELSSAAGNTIEESPEVKLDAERILRDHSAELIRDDGDEAVLRLYLQGEKETSVYADALGLSALPLKEKKKVVKSRRDRIEQRIKRLRSLLK